MMDITGRVRLSAVRVKWAANALERTRVMVAAFPDTQVLAVVDAPRAIFQNLLTELATVIHVVITV